MEQNLENIDDLIAKVLADEATVSERKQLEDWIDLSGDNRNYFDESKKLFEAIESTHLNMEVDVDRAWSRVEEKISNQPAKIISLFSKGNMLRAAASLFLLMTLGFLMYRVMYDEAEPPVEFLATTSTQQQKLPDGSEVFINKNTELVFEKKNNKREVRLKGEAYFNVKHDENEPFVITIDDIIVEDIGTAFNVKALPGSNVIEVLVEEGEVRFYSEDNSGLNLVKGEKATYDRTTRHFTKLTINPSENSISYKSRIFQFNETPLKEVVRQINEVYGSDIRLEDARQGDCTLSVMFNNESLDVLISIITETLDMTAEKKENVVILKGGGCSNE